MKARMLGLTPAEYHQQRSKKPYKLTHSLAHSLVTASPAHALVDLTAGNESNKRQDIGTILHELLLGKGRGFAVADHFMTEDKVPKVSYTWATKAAKEFKELALASGRIPMFTHELAEYERIAGILREKIERLIPEQLGGIEWARGATEEAWEWTEDDVTCRAMVDWRFEAIALDLKIWDSANPSARKLYDMGVDIQKAVDTNLVELIDSAYEDRGQYFALVCEPNAPYAVRLVELEPQLTAIGHKRWNDAKAQFKHCVDTDTWPEYPPVLKVEADLWMLRRWEVSVYPETQAIGGEDYNPEDWNVNNEW